LNEKGRIVAVAQAVAAGDVVDMELARSPADSRPQGNECAEPSAPAEDRPAQKS